MVDLATGAETVLTEHGAASPTSSCSSAWSAPSPSATAPRCRPGWSATPSARARCRCCVDIHGGPHNAWNAAADEIHLYHQELAARGWAVLLVNPRGSDGYGEAFYDAVHGAWGVADANDFLEPIDQLVAEGLADPERLAVAGYSYGGFMTCYLTGHDDRFAAAVAGGVVSDLVSMGGTCDDGHFLSALRARGRAVAGARAVRRDVAADQGRRRADARRSSSTAPPTSPARSARPSSGTPRCASWASRPSWCSTRTPRHVFILLGPAVAAARLQPPGPRLGRAVRRRAAAAPGSTPRHWEHRLAALAKRHQVPGAQLGILRYSPGREDELVEAAYGTLNLATGAPATTTSLFQIGSITKVWTATVVMQLVDEGLVELDTPVVEVLPELRLADPDVTKSVTIRHLLTHTSGIDGDVFTDTGRGDDCLEKYVDAARRGGPEPPARRDLVLLQLRASRSWAG